MATTCLKCVSHEFGSTLRKFIRSRISDETIVDDILHDVLLKIQLRLDSLKDPGKLKPWVYQICRHTIIDHYRRRKIQTESPGNLTVETNAEESLFRQELDVCIQSMIEKLPVKYRQAVMLTAYEGLTQKEMSERLGISVSGAKSRIQRARERLKTELLECCRVEFDKFGKVIDYTRKV